MKQFICIAIASIIVSVSFSIEAQAHFRIRQRPDLLVSEWDELIDEALKVSNPLYEENQQSGENPLYEPESITFNPGEFWQGSPIRFELQLDPELPDGVSLPKGAYAFDIKIIDQLSGEMLTDFPEGLTFSFSIPGLTQQQIDDAGLGYLDESRNPPVWRIEDPTVDECLSSDGGKLLCGKTDHLTTFVIGNSTAIPEPSSLLLLMTGGLLAATRRRVALNHQITLTLSNRLSVKDNLFYFKLFRQYQ